LVGCYTVPQTGRSSFVLINSSDEISTGLQAFQLLKKSEKISGDTQASALVKRVGSRIAKAAREDLPKAEWEFVLFENEEPNAFALPGGKVGVYTGILSITKDEAGLATVLGHEIAHVTARHGSERMSQYMALGALGTGLRIGLNSTEMDRTTKNLIFAAYGIAGTAAAVLPHSRMQESEADKIGLIYMAKAGYPPREAVNFWTRFKEYKDKNGGSPPEFFSTHPTDERRIKEIESLVPQAEIYYKTSISEN
jgi:predicted Zn-dependent protease